MLSIFLVEFPLMFMRHGMPNKNCIALHCTAARKITPCHVTPLSGQAALLPV